MPNHLSSNERPRCQLVTEIPQTSYPVRRPASETAALFGETRRCEDAPRPDIEVSVVVPMFNEANGAIELVREINGAMDGIRHEIVVVDDCSTDATRPRVVEMKARMPQLRVIAHHANAGQSRAIRTGVLAARGALIATLDGDGQNDPADIPVLVKSFNDASSPTLGMVAGVRTRRQDTIAKRYASRAANAIRSRLLKDDAADSGCGLKVFDRSAYLRLPYFDHQHRYLPALMRREGFEVAFMPVSHRPRLHGQSKYTNLGRLAVAFRDLLGVIWLVDRAKSPKTISEL